MIYGLTNYRRYINSRYESSHKRFEKRVSSKELYKKVLKIILFEKLEAELFDGVSIMHGTALIKLFVTEKVLLTFSFPKQF